MSLRVKEVKAVVRFNESDETRTAPLPYSRAYRVAKHGINPEFGRFAGGVAEILVDGEVLETIAYLEEVD